MLYGYKSKHTSQMITAAPFKKRAYNPLWDDVKVSVLNNKCVRHFQMSRMLTFDISRKISHGKLAIYNWILAVICALPLESMVYENAYILKIAFHN